MKQEIIDQMQKHLGKGRFAQSDFEFDLKFLKDYDEPFFWMARENGTLLCKIGINHINSMIANPNPKKAEAARICWFKDFYVFMFSIKYWSDNARYFYYDGCTMIETSLEELEEIYEGHLSHIYREVIRDYKHEYNVAKKRLPIKLRCSISRLKEALYFAESINDTSLIECLRRLRGYSRVAVDQYVSVGSDFTEHGFVFCNTANGESELVGGIIMHSYKNEYKWQIHT